ncbi:hypothetical protein [Methylobacter sp.]|uniref:hypothetical protein n=1 Tax=Methylobacter sp. TaxID=2051955 RepID=UPI003DA3A865
MKRKRIQRSLVSKYAVEVRSGIIIKNAFNGFSQPLIGLISTGNRSVSPAVSH